MQSFIKISDKEATDYMSLGANAFVLACKIARDNGINDPINESQLLNCGSFYRLMVSYNTKDTGGTYGY